MIDRLISIIDRLIQLKEYRTKRRAEAFESLLEPVFNDLLLVHGDYIQMFEHVANLVRKPKNSKRGGHKLQCRRAVEYILRRRLELEPLRVKVRTTSDALSHAKLRREERAFVQTVINYFPDGSLSTWTASSRLAEQIALWNGQDVREGGRDISATLELFDIVEVVGNTIRKTRLNWSRVCETFATLKVAVTPLS